MTWARIERYVTEGLVLVLLCCATWLVVNCQ